MYFAIFKNKVLIPLIILATSVCDDWVLSEGLVFGMGLCLDGVMYGGVLCEGVYPCNSCNHL